jgi:hypothetical protein
VPPAAPDPNADDLTLEQTLEAFRFYEARADSTKAHAWAQTTWILTLNAGLLAFSLDLYANHSSLRGFAAIEWLVALAGVVLCSFLIYTLHELGSHIAHYWTNANALAAAHPALVPFIGGDRAAEEARTPGYRAPFPRFCLRLQLVAATFLVGQIASAALTTSLTA